MKVLNLKKAEKLYKQSIKILKENQHENGGFYASPPGTRYPFIYPRDHSIVIISSIACNEFEMAKKGLDFILNAQKPSGEFSQRYDTDGNDASYKDLQIDGNGLILYALGEYFKKNGANDIDFFKNHWKSIEKAVSFILINKNDDVGLIHTINSIHEYPAYEHGFEIYANSACYAGLFSAISIGEALGRQVSNWKKEAEELKNAILTRMYSPRRRSFIKCIRVKDKNSNPIGCDAFASSVNDIDVVGFAPAYFGLIDHSDNRNITTVKQIHKELWDKEIGGLNRYPEHWGRNNGGYGPWIHFTCQLASHYITIGDQNMAELYLGWVVFMAHDYKLSEHISTIERFELWFEDYTNAKLLRDSKLTMIENIKSHPKWSEGLAYVTTPLIWAHADYIQAYIKYKNTFL